MFRSIIIATILVMAAIFYAPAPAIAATFCAQHVGAHKERDCSFSTLKECRASIRERGGGRCYRKR
jgi:galactitol-specific phosphotransferase system IIC component